MMQCRYGPITGARATPDFDPALHEDIRGESFLYFFPCFSRWFLLLYNFTMRNKAVPWYVVHLLLLCQSLTREL